jgi:hypothetical protein
LVPFAGLFTGEGGKLSLGGTPVYTHSEDCRRNSHLADAVISSELGNVTFIWLRAVFIIYIEVLYD